MRTWLISKNNQKFIMKFPDIEAKESEEILNMFVREAWNGRRIQSEFFPKVIIPDDRTHRYYLMEVFDGKDLDKVLKENGTFDTVSALKVLETLLKSSQYLLKLDLVNGDIKPDNIIQLKNGEFRIVDYGSIVEIFSINSKAGTPSYLAPERFKGAMISEQSEIFSMGVTIYKLLTNKYPYGEIEPFQNPSFHIPPKPVDAINSTVPEWLSIVILRMVHFDTEIRYKYFSEVLFDIQNSDKVEPIYSKDTPLLERDPLKFYKIGFWIMVSTNLLTLLIK
jgi:serine/threonine protein kinase